MILLTALRIFDLNLLFRVTKIVQSGDLPLLFKPMKENVQIWNKIRHATKKLCFPGFFFCWGRGKQSASSLTFTQSPPALRGFFRVFLCTFQHRKRKSNMETAWKHQAHMDGCFTPMLQCKHVSRCSFSFPLAGTTMSVLAFL